MAETKEEIKHQYGIKRGLSYEKTDITFLLPFKDIALKGGVH
ncbi:hypothetical protein ACOY18_02525 [Enterococcus hirae]